MASNPSVLCTTFGVLLLLGAPAAGEESAFEPRGAVTLRAVLAAVLARDPALAAFSSEVRVQEARALQEGLYRNPELRAEVEDFGGGGDRRAFERTQTTLSVAQVLELGGKPGKRRRVALLDRDLADWDYAAARADALARAGRAFVAVLAAQERLRIERELGAVAERAEAAVREQQRAGAASPLDVARVRVEAGNAVVARVQAERELAAARVRLAASWGDSRASFTEVRGDLAAMEPPPTFEALLDHLARNPDLARWAVELERREAALRLERVRRVPDVTVRFGGRHFSDTDDNAMVTEVSVPLPLFDRNQGAVAEARHRLDKARAEQRAAEVTARSALAIAHEELDAEFARATALQDRVLPHAEAAHRAALEGYRAGQLSQLEALVAHRVLFGLRRDQVEAEAAYHTAAVEVERLTASPVGALSGAEGQ